MVFQTLNVSKEGGVLFAKIAAPPMNLLGPALVRDLVSLIQQGEADDTAKVLVFKIVDPDYFIAHVDVIQIKEYRAEAARLTGEASIGLMFRYLSAIRLPRRRRHPASRASGGPRSRGGDHVRRTGLRCGAGRTIRLD